MYRQLKTTKTILWFSCIICIQIVLCNYKISIEKNISIFISIDNTPTCHFHLDSISSTAEKKIVLVQ